MEKDAFYQFTQKTYPIHPIAMAVALYAVGGIPHLIWGMVSYFAWFWVMNCFGSKVDISEPGRSTEGSFNRRKCQGYVSCG